MTTTAPPHTFAHLEPAGLEMAVTCQVAAMSPSSTTRRQGCAISVCRRRYRCAQCGAIGLPSLGTRRLAEHANKLRVDLSGGELPGQKVEPRR